MLRERAHVIPYPNRGIIEDVANRVGPATPDCFTPFSGKREEIESQFKGKYRAKFSMDMLIKEGAGDKDFNPRLARRTIETGLLSEKEDKPSGMYLEDFVKDGKEDQAISQYVMNLCVGLKINAKSVLKESTPMMTRTITNYSDDGDNEIEEKMLLIQEDDALSADEYEETIRELPYLIKAIWYYSKVYQANLFSFAFAWKDMIENGVTNVNIRNFADYSLYYLKRNGEFIRQFDHAADNKNQDHYPKITKIFIYPGDHPTEFGLCLKYLNCLEKLGIDYRDEDAMMYNNEFVESLVCTYIPDNDEYFKTYSGVDLELRMALQPSHILSTPKAMMYVQSASDKKIGFDYSDTIYFIGERLKMLYRFADEETAKLFTIRHEKVYEILGEVLYLMNKDKGNNTRLVVPKDLCNFEVAGILYVHKELMRIPGKYFGPCRGRTDYQVVVTEYGFLIAVEESYNGDLIYLTAEDALEQLEEYEINGESINTANWRSL